MASIIREKVGKDGKIKYRYSNYDNEKLKKGETLIKSGISKEEAFDYVAKANKGDKAALNAIANMEKATQEQIKAEEATKRTEADKKAKEAEIAAAKENLQNAQLYGSDQDINAAQAYLNSLLGKENKPFVEPGQVQWTSSSNDNPTVKAAVDAYNSTTGTFNGFLQTLREAGYSDDTIETIMTNNDISGDKAQEWLDERHGTKNKDLTAQGSLQAKGTPVTTKNLEEEKKKIEEKEKIKAAAEEATKELRENAQKDIDKVINEPPAHTVKGIDTNTPKTEEPPSDPGNTKPEEPPSDPGNTKPETKTETKTETDDEAKDFWKKWRAGALRAYPMLQSIGDAISRNARMTADRAALLTGGQRDTEAYDPIEIKQMTPEQRVQLAFADAEAGNYDTLKQLVMSGEVSVENAAQALNMSTESLQGKFARGERSEESDTKNKEISVEQNKENLTKSIMENKQQVRDNILFIDEQIRQIDKDINALEGKDYDTYNKVLSDYVNNYAGYQTLGTLNSKNLNDTNSLGGDMGTGEYIEYFVKANIRDTWTHATGTSDSASTSKDVLAIEALPKGEEYAQMAFNERNAANNKLIEKLEERREKLVTLRDSLESEYAEATKETVTRLNYGPKSTTVPTTEEPTPTVTKEENTNAE